MEPLTTAIRQSTTVTGIQVGSITEILALYADDLGLFLNDPRPSLRETLGICSRFTVLSGLKVNWEKCQILPSDPEASQSADPYLLLSWASSICYLGIALTSNVLDYIKLNLLPLLNMLKAKLRAWDNLPLSLIGRINLLKKKMLPFFQYMIRHVPTWIPKTFFNQFDTAIS